MKTKIVLMRVPFKVKRQIIFERDLVRARGDAATLTGADRYNAARRVERLQERREALYELCEPEKDSKEVKSGN